MLAPIREHGGVGHWIHERLFDRTDYPLDSAKREEFFVASKDTPGRQRLFSISALAADSSSTP